MRWGSLWGEKEYMNKAKFHKMLVDNKNAFEAADFYELEKMIVKEESKSSSRGKGANSTAANYARSYQKLSEIVNKNHNIESEIAVVCKELKEMLYEELKTLAFKRKNLTEIASKFLSRDPKSSKYKKAVVLAYNDRIYYAYCDGYKMILSPKDFGYGIYDTKTKGSDETIINWLDIFYKKEKESITIPLTDEIITDIFISKYINDNYYRIKNANGEIIVNAAWLKYCIDFTKATEIKVSGSMDTVFFHGIEDRHAMLSAIRP